ncbi:DUF3114 domain-containing protein [Eupransor demetentiae]|uniref:DUF3114 domain-containing protein n=1 Tax=Eupransor demetentiae TaxID=3109584 RepID=A0ABP0EP18_9LACO|nr:hypothetical protein R54876_GBNLAHCA_00594 [Lactobacillaceae bacterium LMG 33000]
MKLRTAAPIKIKRSKGQFRGNLDFTSAQEQSLSEDGWSKGAIAAAKKALYQADWSSLKAIQQRQARLWQAIHEVGSPVYTAMYRAQGGSPAERLNFVLQHFGAVIDDFGFLQLTGSYRFSSELAPHSDFYKLFRTDVQHTFKSESLADIAEGNGELATLAQKIHLLRYHFDRHNVAYIRSTYPGDDDFQKLLNYQSFCKVDFDYQTDATYHNRYQGEFKLPDNFKVQVPEKEKMSEFIVNFKTGNFVSEWNVLQLDDDGIITDPSAYDNEDLKAIADTESFNYGQVHKASHRLLDIDHPADGQLRRAAVKAYPYEHDFNDDDAPGRYIDIVKGGGRFDYYAWQQVKEEDQAYWYQAFLTYCQEHKMKNPGFAYFYNAQLKRDEEMAEKEAKLEAKAEKRRAKKAKKAGKHEQ